MVPFIKRIRFWRLLSFIISLILFSTQAQAAPSTSVKITRQDCLECHADNDPVINPEILDTSVHQGLNCVDCHRDITDLPHPDKLKRVDCSVCHAKENKTYLGSVHGLNAACSDCHGTHDIKKATNRSSKLYWVTIPKTCGHCHQKEYAAYSRGIHGQALTARIVMGNMTILPSIRHHQGSHLLISRKLAGNAMPQNVLISNIISPPMSWEATCKVIMDWRWRKVL